MVKPETPEEKANRRFIELLQESRVAQHGVQIIFAFLLAAVFTEKFDTIELYQKCIYSAAIISAAISTILFVAPVIQHRLLFGQGYKDEIIEVATKTTQWALSFMLSAMLLGIFLVMDIAFNVLISSLIVVIPSVLAIIVWYVVPVKLKQNEVVE